MVTSTPDTTRQLVADRHARLAAEAQPRRQRAPAAPPRQRPRRRRRALAHLLPGRT